VTRPTTESPSSNDDNAALPRAALQENANYLIGVALATLGVLCFSLRPVLVKLAYRYATDPVTLLALRMAFSAPLFLLVAAWQGPKKGATAISPRDGIAIVALGFVGYYLASFLDFLGLQYISAGLGRLVLFLYPTLVVMLSLALLGKRVARREVVALIVSYAGLALALAHAPEPASANLPLGTALVFASAVAYAIYLVGGSQVLLRVGSLRFSTYATLVACAFCILQFFLLRPLSALDLPWQVYGISAVIGVVCTVLPIFMTSEALRRIGARLVAMIGALGPRSAIVWSYLGLGEGISGLELAGGALVVSGVLLVTVKPKARARGGPAD
jgi:drug/metabolite transporter (DMT)-like permease